MWIRVGVGGLTFYEHPGEIGEVEEMEDQDEAAEQLSSDARGEHLCR